MIQIALPFPPSVNNLYANGKRGRYKTSAYEAWIKEASAKITDSHRQSLKVYHISICLRRPNKRRRDLANLEKAISDLLVSNGVIADDSGCERLTMQWDHGQKDECVVIVMPAEEALAA